MPAALEAHRNRRTSASICQSRLDSVTKAYQRVFKFILIAPVFPNRAEVRVVRLIESVFNVVVPDHSTSKYADSPETTTRFSVSRFTPLLRRNADAFPELSFGRLHSCFCSKNQVPDTRFGNWLPAHIEIIRVHVKRQLERTSCRQSSRPMDWDNT